MAKSITTSQGKTFPVLSVFSPGQENALRISLKDSRRVPAIAADFDGLTSLVYTDDARNTETEYRGFDTLYRVQSENGTVSLILKKA